MAISNFCLPFRFCLMQTKTFGLPQLAPPAVRELVLVASSQHGPSTPHHHQLKLKVETLLASQRICSPCPWESSIAHAQLGIRDLRSGRHTNTSGHFDLQKPQSWRPPKNRAPRSRNGSLMPSSCPAPEQKCEVEHKLTLWWNTSILLSCCTTSLHPSCFILHSRSPCNEEIL